MSYYENFSLFDHDHPYSLSSFEKNKIFLSFLNELTAHHIKNSTAYAKIVSSQSNQFFAYRLEDVPFIPVRLFKFLDLLSVPRESVYKTLTSSGTSGQSLSRIYLGRDNAAIQAKILGAIMADFLGKQRLPMLIIDAENILKDRAKFNARAAGILGFSMYGRGHAYALDGEMNLKLESLILFLEKYRESGIFVFGFTFVIWKFLLQALEKAKFKVDFGARSLLLHGGGWKKLNEESVSSEVFKFKLLKQAGLRKIHNYYGMVEQTGSIYMECAYGHLHTSNYSDVIIRDPISFKPLSFNEQGLVQVISLLPFSYPGHSLLTEDMGILLGEDDCPCGRMGRYFHIMGRMDLAEIRGCSDVRSFT